MIIKSPGLSVHAQLPPSSNLVDGHTECVKGVCPAVNAGLVIDTVEAGAVTAPQRPERPAAQLGNRLAGVVERRRCHAVLDPVDDLLQSLLRPASVGLLGVALAVGTAGDQEQTVEIIHGGNGLIEAHVGVHDVADALVVVDAAGGGDGVVLLAVDVDDLAAGVVDSLEVGVGRLEDVAVAVHAEGHPVAQGVGGDVVERVEVVGVLQLEEAGDPLAAEARGLKAPGTGGAVVGGLGLVVVGADLEVDVDALSVRVEQAVHNSLVVGGVLGGDGAVLGRDGAGHHGLGDGGAGVRLADSRVEVHVQQAQVGAGNDTVGQTVERVAEGDGQVGDLLEGARGRDVADVFLNDGRRQVVDLLLAIAEGRGADGGTVELISKTLDLRPTLTSSLGAALVVGVDLVGDVVQVGSVCLAQCSELVVSLVAEHVGGLPVDGVVGSEEDGIELSVEVAKATIGDTTHGSDNDT